MGLKLFVGDRSLLSEKSIKNPIDLLPASRSGETLDHHNWELVVRTTSLWVIRYVDRNGCSEGGTYPPRRDSILEKWLILVVVTLHGDSNTVGKNNVFNSRRNRKVFREQERMNKSKTVVWKTTSRVHDEHGYHFMTGGELYDKTHGIGGARLV